MKYYVLATFFALSAPVDAMPDMKNRLNNFKGKMKSKISPDMKMPDVKKGLNNMKGKLKSKISPAKKKNSVTYPDDLLFLSDWKDNYSRPFQVAMVEYKLAWEAQSAAIKKDEKKRDKYDADKVSKTTETMENAMKKYAEAKSKIIKKLDIQVPDWDDEVFNYQEGTDDEGYDFQGFEIQNQNLN